MMRIIAGDWRSRKLIQPDTRETRPMPDRVKAAIFSMLGSHFDCPGALPPICVADVFAGGGSMGLEALSRGARFCSFFERGPAAIQALEKNVVMLDAVRRSELIRRDAWRSATRTLRDEPFDLVLLDPPYRDSTEVSKRGSVRRYLGRLAERCNDECVVMLHHDERTHFALEADEAWFVADERTFGSNAVTLFLRNR